MWGTENSDIESLLSIRLIAIALNNRQKSQTRFRCSFGLSFIIHVRQCPEYSRQWSLIVHILAYMTAAKSPVNKYSVLSY